MSISTLALLLFQGCKYRNLSPQRDGSNFQDDVSFSLFYSSYGIMQRYAVWTMRKYHGKGLTPSLNPRLRCKTSQWFKNVFTYISGRARSLSYKNTSLHSPRQEGL